MEREYLDQHSQRIGGKNQNKDYPKVHKDIDLCYWRERARMLDDYNMTQVLAGLLGSVFFVLITRSYFIQKRNY